MPEAKKMIVCLFSVDNNYDQPNNNLVAWWSEKPGLEQLSKALGLNFPATEDATTIAIVKVWSGEGARISDTDYRLQDVLEGETV